MAVFSCASPEPHPPLRNALHADAAAESTLSERPPLPVDLVCQTCSAQAGRDLARKVNSVADVARMLWFPGRPVSDWLDGWFGRQREATRALKPRLR